VVQCEEEEEEENIDLINAHANGAMAYINKYIFLSVYLMGPAAYVTGPRGIFFIHHLLHLLS